MTLKSRVCSSYYYFHCYTFLFLFLFTTFTNLNLITRAWLSEKSGLHLLLLLPLLHFIKRCFTTFNITTRAWLSEKSGLQFCSSRPLIRTMVIGTSAVLATLSSSLLCRREKRFRKESAGRQLHSEIGLTTHVKHPSVHCIARLARCFAWFAIFCFSCKLFSRFAPPGVVAVASSAEVSAASSSSCASVGSSVYCGSLSSNFWMRMYSPSTAFSMGL
mmetsp:Transcript_30707/g.70401  ORF Transcript_30707/g.70401 Transcript_30707/m.70401 type:complete len:217 (+) Transcript_30707:21-671(+)